MPASSYSPRCEYCGQRSPLVFRGLETRCAACNAVRLPLVAPNLSLAGQPSRFGGIAAAIVGWSVLVLGMSVAIAAVLLLQSFWPASFIGWAFGVPIAIASLFFGLLLVLGGKKLERRGVEKQRGVRLEAVRALIAHRGFAVTPQETAEALSMSESEADAWLTELARDAATDVRIDVDDNGHLRYDFRGDAATYRVLEEELKARVAPDDTEEGSLDAPPGRRRVQS